MKVTNIGDYKVYYRFVSMDEIGRWRAIFIMKLFRCCGYIVYYRFVYITGSFWLERYQICSEVLSLMKLLVLGTISYINDSYIYRPRLHRQTAMNQAMKCNLSTMKLLLLGAIITATSNQVQFDIENYIGHWLRLWNRHVWKRWWIVICCAAIDIGNYIVDYIFVYIV